MIWQACDGAQQIAPLAGTLYRLVESQEQVAIMTLVDTLEEQSILEALLEDANPPCPVETDALHYLLKTPFRYPPLQWGSRFGRVNEPSLFYGGCNTLATLAEAAYYRLVFLTAMDGRAPRDSLRTEHTLFSARYSTAHGIQLQHPPFDEHRAQLTDPRHYEQPQALGSEMRAADIEAFEYRSARAGDDHCCVALYTPVAFAATEPDSMEPWLCETTLHGVTFKSISAGNLYRFDATQFYCDGALPTPA